MKNKRIITGSATRELFTDCEQIESLNGVDLRLHHPERCEVVFSPEEPYGSNLTGQGTILELPQGGWRMYFRGGSFWRSPFTEKRGTSGIFAAESENGIDWKIVTPQSILSEDTFGPVMVRPLTASIFLDGNPDAPEDEIFKMLVPGRRPPDDEGGLFLAVSADGLNFRLKTGPMPIESQYDTQNILFWDPRIGKYRIYTRIRRFGIRGIRMHLTEDFKTFTNASDLTFRNDPFPQTQIYTNSIQPYFRAEKYYFGFPVRYCDHGQKWDESALYPPGVDRRVFWANDVKKIRLATVATDSLFMSSRDGWVFDRQDESFLRPGPCTEGNWIYGDHYLFYGMIPTRSRLGFGAPDELSLYGVENYIGDQGKSVRFRRLAIRQDGFVSAHFPARGGEVLTRSFEMDDDSLSLNLATSAWGYCSVEILDEDGREIPGFREREMFPIYGDSLDFRPMWKNSGSDLSALRGRKICLRFRGRDADLYSYARVPFRKDPVLPALVPEADREESI